MTETIKQCANVSKKAKNTGQIRKIFDMLCNDQMGKTYSMILYSHTTWNHQIGKTCNIMLKSPTRSTTFNHMFLILFHLWYIFIIIGIFINEDCIQREIYPTIKFPSQFKICMSSVFRSNIQKCSTIMDTISNCFWLADQTKIAHPYATFMLVRHVLNKKTHLLDDSK